MPVVCGRDNELRALSDPFAQASAGRGSLVFITGEPGIGKSRLVRELTGYAQDISAVAVTGRAVPGGRARLTGRSPRRCCRFCGTARCHPMPTCERGCPRLQAILPGLGPTGDTGRAEDARASPVARGEGIIQLVRRLVTDTGLLVALEDLHWADPDTLAVLEYLADNAAGERILFLATSRDELDSAGVGLARRLARRRAASHLSLGRLGVDDVARMVRACLPGADDQLLARAQVAADGVPFLVEEVLASPGVPDSFADTVRERLARFTAAERCVLEAAALLGRSFDWRLLAAAAGAESAVVIASLERAVASQLLAAEGEVFRFRHALTREAVAAGTAAARQAVARCLGSRRGRSRASRPGRPMA